MTRSPRPLRAVKRSFKQPLPMVSSSAKEIFIQGLTLEGKTFRPSDWADRLCGVMSQVRPGGPQPGSHLTYSPWCVPTLIGDVNGNWIPDSHRLNFKYLQDERRLSHPSVDGKQMPWSESVSAALRSEARRRRGLPEVSLGKVPFR